VGEGPGQRERERERERSRRSVKMDEIGRYQQNMFRAKRTAVMFQVRTSAQNEPLV